MELINSNEVQVITGFSYRYLQMLLNAELKTRPEIPHYKVIGKRIFKGNKWLDIPDHLAKSRVVYERIEVERFFNDNYLK